MTGLEIAMSNVMLDEETLYYQYLINNNSTSTMLNAISGNYSNNGLDALSSISSLGSLSSLGSVSGVSDFSSILQNYLTGVTANSYTESLEAATMADKLSSVLEEAEETEDTSSLTYKTVQELYEYFSEQVSAKASALMGTASDGKESSSSKTAVSSETSTIEQMNQAAMQGKEIDFSEIDDIVEAAFAEQLSW